MLLVQAREKLCEYQRLENELNKNRGWETDQFILQKQVINFNKQYDNYLTEIDGLLTKIEQNKDLSDVTNNLDVVESHPIKESNSSTDKNVSKASNDQQFNLAVSEFSKTDKDADISISKIANEELYERTMNNLSKKYEGIPVDVQERIKRTAKILAAILIKDGSIEPQVNQHQSETPPTTNRHVKEIVNETKISDTQREGISMPAMSVSDGIDNEVDKVIEKNVEITDTIPKTETSADLEMLITPEAVEVYKQTYNDGEDAWKRDFETYIQTYVPIKNGEGWMSKWFDARSEVKGGILDHLAESQMTIEQFDNLSEGDVRELRNYLRQNNISIVDFRALKDMLDEIRQIETVQISKDMTVQQVQEAGFVDRLVRLTVKQS